MLGDRAPLADVVKLKDAYSSTLLLDEAHSLGVLGKTGQGLVEETGLIDKVDFITGTFSKSLGGIGGYCVTTYVTVSVTLCQPPLYIHRIAYTGYYCVNPGSTQITA